MPDYFPTPVKQLGTSARQAIMHGGFQAYMELMEAALQNGFTMKDVEYAYIGAVQQVPHPAKPFYDYDGTFLEGWETPTPNSHSISAIVQVLNMISMVASQNNRVEYMQRLELAKHSGVTDEQLKDAYDYGVRNAPARLSFNWMGLAQ